MLRLDVGELRRVQRDQNKRQPDRAVQEIGVRRASVGERAVVRRASVGERGASSGDRRLHKRRQG